MSPNRAAFWASPFPMPPQPINAMPGRSFGLVGGLAAVSAAAASSLWTNHKGNPAAAAVAVQEARKDRREIWTDLFMKPIENLKLSTVKRNYRKELLSYEIPGPAQPNTCGLTQFGGRWPAQTARRLSTAIMPILVRVPMVALPRCGASTPFSRSH